jgi:hypothetical protein
MSDDPETVLVLLSEYVDDVGEPGVTCRVPLDLAKTLVQEGRATPAETVA